MYSSKRFGFAARRAGAIVLLATLLGSSVAMAQQPAPRPPVPPAIPPATQLFLSDMYPGLKLDPYLENHRTGFFLIDADIDGKLTQNDIDLHAQAEANQKRSAATTFVMSFDLDGDGAVTEDEIRRAFKYNNRMDLGRAAFNTTRNLPVTGAAGREQTLEDDVRSIMALDTDKDGRVVLAEASKFSTQGYPLSQGVLSGRTRTALMLDTVSAREVTMADYLAAAVALFNKIDSDGDGVISQQELADYRQRPDTPEGAARIAAAELVQKRQREQDDAVRKKLQEDEAARAGCAMPKASERARVVVLSGYETEALSSVALGSQDAVVRAGRIVVEPGAAPLYIVIPTLTATIWQFSGAVERIERLMMSSVVTGVNGGKAELPPLVGATGIAPERLSFFARSDCVRYFYQIPSTDSVQTIAAIRSATGKEPDIVAAKYSVSGFAVPSGKIETFRDDGPQPLIIQKSQGTLNIIGDSSNVIIQAGPSRARDELYRSFPSGVVDIDPRMVVASVSVAAYEVLPAEAGLVQLLANGALTWNSSSEYVVHKKTRFPAGLSGGVTFVIGKGIPYPDGDPGPSCVIMEATGESNGWSCRSR
jgi:Ca2+-binding EF-hand superfamily protein